MARFNRIYQRFVEEVTDMTAEVHRAGVMALPAAASHDFIVT